MRPPHLSAIAPWEAASDQMREMQLRGGMASNIPFMKQIMKTMSRHHLVEDITKMTVLEQDFGPYWQNKRVPFERITIPTYVVASWDNMVHSQGTFAAWRGMASKDKWLRVNNTHEWPDLYQADNTEELRRFFDRYLKGIDNGWESTPRTRISMLDPGRTDEVGRVIGNFPAADYLHRPLYLSYKGTLSEKPQPNDASVSYPVEQPFGASFRFKVDTDSELLGYCKLRLWVEVDGADDMDIFVYVGKLDKDGNNSLLRLNPYGALMLLRALGMLRVSRRELDPKVSTHRRNHICYYKANNA